MENTLFSFFRELKVDMVVKYFSVSDYRLYDYSEVSSVMGKIIGLISSVCLFVLLVFNLTKEMYIENSYSD